MKDIEITKEDWEVIEKRAEELPENFHIGMLGVILSKAQLVDNIKHRTSEGEAYVKMQLRFIKWSTKRLLEEAEEEK
ncbi:MAG: hypothetical protein KKF67_01995 [Nanoarchaeota archaeon]|nr:hypothetical protein [Nanoarchaeota archaeon]